MSENGFGSDFQPLGAGFDLSGNITPDLIWGDVMDFQPNIPYFGMLSQQSFSPNQQNYYNNNFQDVFNQYQGALYHNIQNGLQGGSQLNAGNFPGSLRWNNWIQDFNFQDNYRQLPMSQRGGNTSAQFSPFVRWMQ